MKKWILVAALTTCCLSVVTWFNSSQSTQTANAAEPAGKIQSTQADFQEFCKSMQGRWIGEVIWITDWPGFGKKGDKVTAYSEFTHSDNGHVLRGRFNGGPGSGTAMFFYDAGKRQIQGQWVSSGGTVWNITTYKKDGQWHHDETGSIADGKPITSSITRHVSDDGKTHRMSGTVEIDGEALDPVRDVWHRIGD